MHRPVAEQRQDRGAHVSAPGPAPRPAAPAAPAEGAAAEGRSERSEGGTTPLEPLPTIGPAVAVAPAVLMSVLSV
ncbi:hypothetical protein BGK67_06455 [Streptomyces subrutilus]|uniref:Uncharacterized protein n=1 Tax=Streptomyces subrutilus TaxID=36818 RepID=A0A1E5PNB1_9ACTN|nr:hypothetical protein BGK67_06455 [Streptomyces subrutilus]